MDPFNSTWTMDSLGSIWNASAISRPSTRAFSKLCWRYSRLTVEKFVLSSSSMSLERFCPGGVSLRAWGLSMRVSSADSCSSVGLGVLSVLGMYITVFLRPQRVLGEMCWGVPSYPSSSTSLW